MVRGRSGCGHGFEDGYLRAAIRIRVSFEPPPVHRLELERQGITNGESVCKRAHLRPLHVALEPEKRVWLDEGELYRLWPYFFKFREILHIYCLNRSTAAS